MTGSTTVCTTWIQSRPFLRDQWRGSEADRMTAIWQDHYANRSQWHEERERLRHIAARAYQHEYGITQEHSQQAALSLPMAALRLFDNHNILRSRPHIIFEHAHALPPTRPEEWRLEEGHSASVQTRPPYQHPHELIAVQQPGQTGITPFLSRGGAGTGEAAGDADNVD